MTLVYLTQALCNAAAPRERRYDLRDSLVRGLFLRVEVSGRKTWYICYRTPSPERRLRNMKIASAAYAQLAAARRTAKEYLARLYLDNVDPAEAQEPPRADGPTLRALIDMYEPWVCAHQKSGAVTVRALRLFSEFMDAPASEIDAVAVARWREENMGRLKRATINRRVAALQALLSWGAKEGLCRAAMKLPKLAQSDSKVVTRFLEDGERARLMAELAAREARSGRDYLRPAVILSLNTGIRKGTLLGLRWGDVDFASRTLRLRAEIMKAGREAVVPLNDAAFSALSEWRAPQGYVEGFHAGARQGRYQKFHMALPAPRLCEPACDEGRADARDSEADVPRLACNDAALRAPFAEFARRGGAADLLTVTHRLHGAPELPARPRAARRGGAFKGAQPATRYEMASVVARALVTVDAEKASKQDLELLKKLVMEFKDELDALGVKVDSLDKRVAVLEENLGGWKLRGIFWFDASFGGDGWYHGSGMDTEFNKQRLRMYLSKQIDENTLFYAELRTGENEGEGWGRGDILNSKIRDIYVQTKLPWDLGFRVGRLLNDWEGDRDFYDEVDAIFTDFRYDGFELTKTWGGLKAQAFVGRNTNREHSEFGLDVKEDLYDEMMDNDVFMSYGLNLDWQINEKFFAGASLFIFDQDEGHLNVSSPDGDYTLNINGDYSFNTYNAYLGYSFTPDITLQGIYYWQDLDDDLAAILTDLPAGQNPEDSPTAWKAVLKLDQDLLKFTSLRFEYAETDNMFYGTREYYGLGTDTGDAPHVLSNMPWNNETTSTIFVRADQQWNEKWSSYIRYVHADYDTNGLDDADNWGVAVKYQYTPAIAFRLAYDYIDFGSGNGDGNYNGDDHVIQFRTTISF